MENPRISIIIPVYNAEKTISKCIESILQNGFRDYEIVLINDGSSDGSLEILKEYEKKYPEKIKIISQENQGVAVARNVGIEKTIGEFVMFVDNDDFVDSDYLQIFLDAIEKSNLDVVIGGYRRTDGNKTLFEMKLKNTAWSKYMVMAPWAKIYRKSFLLKNEIQFLKNNIGEDVYFNLLAINLTDKISIIDYCGYNWFYNPQSVSNSKQKQVKNKLDVMNLLDSSHEKLREMGLENKQENEFYFIRYVVWYLLFAGRNSSSEEIFQEYERTFEWLRKNYANFEANKYVGLFVPRGETLKNRIAVVVFMMLRRLGLVKLFFGLYSK